ncbi:tubulin-folding cofactor E isoform X2 [Olea europaea var. sylvestris]|uniref:tubulin-folding cofactor E isoform X2 n=1 Tax=Olea europaea var. sylvestris TaxID=158386 RepID=UPI000C1CE89D|nr:tubulin-folding cofactor E isoform X2 [Olea europaea var. sylvestris]
MQNPPDSSSSVHQTHSDPECGFRVGKRVHWIGDTRRIGTVKYVGPVEGFSGTWVGVDWDNEGDGKHDGSHNGVKYFDARGLKTASFVRPHNLSSGISLLQALEVRYRTVSTKEEEDLKELDLTGNLLAEWNDVGIICKALPFLAALNLSCNSLSPDITTMPQLNNIRILVLNHTGVIWKQVEMLKDSLPCIEELHLLGNKLREITAVSTTAVQGFDFLRCLNLEDNYIADWAEILKLSQLKSLEQLFLNKNDLNRIWYPDYGTTHKLDNGCESLDKNPMPFNTLQCLLLGGNKIEDLDSIDSLNSFPNLVDIRLSENPIADIGKGGVPRFVLIARLAKVETLNGSEVSPRERKDSEIRYVRLVMSKFHDNPEEITRLHPRFAELKKIHGIEDERPLTGATGPQKMASGLISVSLKCVGASIGEKPPVMKKLPATTTVGKLKNLCQSFFKLKSVKPVLFLQEEDSPLPILLEDDMASLIELGVGNESTILVNEES